MIKISSFYPFQGFLRITQEFHEDKAFVKVKSLTFERDLEFKYKDVTEISDGFQSNNSQMNFAFWLLVFNAYTFSFFCDFIYNHPILFRIEQILFIGGLLLYISGFKKSWRIYMFNRNSHILTSIQQTRQNGDLVSQVVEMVKKRAENVVEITVTNPFPEQNPVFEHSDYDISSISKTTEKFYENELLGCRKSIFSESIYHVAYNQLDGKVYRGKSNIDILSVSFTVFVLLTSIIIGLKLNFGVKFGTQFLYILYTFGALFLLSIPLSLIKREIIGLYGPNEEIDYWTYVNRNNKTKIEKIIEFIQSKIPTEEKS